eukprot:jgi/Botrbrau1/18949/Bobra.0522s0001.1
MTVMILSVITESRQKAAHSLTQPLPDITGFWGARLRSETHNRDHWAGGKGRGSDMTTPVQ